MARMRLALLLAACVLAFTAFEAFADTEWEAASAEHRALLGKGGEYSKGKHGGDKPDVHKIVDKVVDHVEDKIEKIAKKVVSKGGKWGHGDDKGGKHPRHLLGSEDGKGKHGGYDKPDVHKIVDKVVDHVEDKIEKIAKKVVSKDGKWGHGDDKGGKHPRHLLGSEDGKGKHGGYDKTDVHKIVDKVVDHVEDKIEKIAKKVVSKGGKWGHGDDKGGKHPRHLLGSEDGKGKHGSYDKPDVHKIVDKVVDHVEDKIEKIAKKVVSKGGKWGHGDDKGGKHPRHLLGSEDGKGKHGGYDTPDVHKIVDQVVDHVEDKIEKIAKKVVSKGGKWGHGDDKGGKHPRHLLGDSKGKEGNPKEVAKIQKEAEKFVKKVEKIVDKADGKHGGGSKEGHGKEEHGKEEHGHKDKYGRLLLSSKEEHHDEGKGHYGKGHGKEDHEKEEGHGKEEGNGKGHSKGQGHSKEGGHGKEGHGKGGHKGGSKYGHRHLLGNKEEHGAKGSWGKPHGKDIGEKIEDHIEKKIGSKGKGGHKKWGRLLLSSKEEHHNEGKGNWGKEKEFGKKFEKIVEKIEKIGNKGDWGKPVKGHKDGKWSG